MADQPTEKPDGPAPAADGPAAAPLESKPAQTDSTAKEETKPEETSTTADDPKQATNEHKPEEKSEEKKPSAEGDSEMPDAPETAVAESNQATGAVAEKTPLTNNKNNRRKSAGGGNNRKSLNKKASKAKITHLDVQPGDHFMVKLKGYPEWPAIIADDSMLPPPILNTRPVTAKRADGTYAEAYADGGKKAQDRNYPVMFLQTNEFAWVANTALTDLEPDVALQKAEKAKKDLKLAFELSAERKPVEFYKDLLHKFEQEREAELEALAAAAATPKKSKKKAKGGDDEDVDMADADASVKSKTKKRKAEDGNDTPQRPDSVKKPKIKLNTNSTPKSTNGTAKDPAKAKPKSSKKSTSKEKPETPEEALKRRQKEVLYLRYKLQRGLLSKEGEPLDKDMADMSKFFDMLEAFQNLESSIIRETRINKVMKQIMKLDSIPKESEFKFKSRSQELLNKWNKVMASDGATNGANGANGVNGAKSPTEEKKSGTPAEKTEVVAPSDDTPAEKPEEKSEATEEKPEAKVEPAEPAKSAEPEGKAEELAKEAPSVAA